MAPIEPTKGGVNVEALIINTLQNMPADKLASLLAKAGAAPTTIGITPEMLKGLLDSRSAGVETAVRETLRLERRENPSYPERSVFFPLGKFDDKGGALRSKHTLKRRTYHNGVLLGGELETEEEIDLYNQFTEDRTARDGRWTAEIHFGGTSRERLVVKTPSFTIDDRTEYGGPLSNILRELLSGPEAVNQLTMEKRIKALEQRNSELESKVSQPAA